MTIMKDRLVRLSSRMRSIAARSGGGAERLADEELHALLAELVGLPSDVAAAAQEIATELNNRGQSWKVIAKSSQLTYEQAWNRWATTERSTPEDRKRRAFEARVTDDRGMLVSKAAAATGMYTATIRRAINRTPAATWHTGPASGAPVRVTDIAGMLVAVNGAEGYTRVQAEQLTGIPRDEIDRVLSIGLASGWVTAAIPAGGRRGKTLITDLEALVEAAR